MRSTLQSASRTTRDRQTDGSAGNGQMDGTVTCLLCVAGASFPVELPAHAIERLAAAPSLLLRVPSVAPLPVSSFRLLTESDQLFADRWLAEMQDLDRF